MNEVYKAAQDGYFHEVAIRLGQAGFQTLPQDGECLPVRWDGAADVICSVTGSGGIRYYDDENLPAEAIKARDQIMTIAGTVAEYMNLMLAAPMLAVDGLEDKYRLLADFNGTVLATRHTEHGVQFVTWDWDYDRKGVHQGNYFGGDYGQAKQDFAVRAGLVRSASILSPEQMVEVYRSLGQ